MDRWKNVSKIIPVMRKITALYNLKNKEEDADDTVTLPVVAMVVIDDEPRLGSKSIVPVVVDDDGLTYPVDESPYDNYSFHGLIFEDME